MELHPQYKFSCRNRVASLEAQLGMGSQVEVAVETVPKHWTTVLLPLEFSAKITNVHYSSHYKQYLFWQQEFNSLIYQIIIWRREQDKVPTYQQISDKEKTYQELNERNCKLVNVQANESTKEEWKKAGTNTARVLFCPEMQWKLIFSASRSTGRIKQPSK